MRSLKSEINYRHNDKESCAYITAIVGFYFMKVLGTSIDNIWGYILIWQVFSKIVQLLLLIPVIYYLLQRPKYFILTEMIMGVVYFSGFINAELSTMIHSALYGCCIYIPLAFATCRIRNKQQFIQALYFISWVSVPFLTLSLYIAYINDPKYDMTSGYLLLLPLLVFTLSFIERQKIKDFIVSVFSVLFILLYGSRGPLLCWIFLIIISLLCLNSIKPMRRFALVFIGCIVTLSLVVGYEYFLYILKDVSEFFDVNSRSISLLLNGEVVGHSSGRSVLLGYFIEKIKLSPVIGYGAFGAWPSPGEYPHNIFVELIVSFGIPLGVTLILGILFIVIRGVLVSDMYTQKLIILFLSMSVSLLVSGSFLTNWHFYVCIALCISVYNKNLYIKHKNQK